MYDVTKLKSLAVCRTVQIVRRGLARILSIGNNVESDLLSLVEGTHASAFDRADVHEDILAAIIRLDEAEAFLAVEPLHDSMRHMLVFQIVPHTGDIPPSRPDRKGVAHMRQTRALDQTCVRSSHMLWHKDCFENHARPWACSSHLGPPSVGGLFVYKSSNNGSDHHEGSCVRQIQFYVAAGREKESSEMKASIASIVVGAIVLAGATTA